MSKYNSSIIIAFYNKIDFLKLVFSGLERQTERQFEVIIADDGSNNKAVAALKGLIEEASFDCQHIAHEDNGWRKNIILNKAIRASQSEYLIFMDADCIPHRGFINEHIINKEQGKILAGRRANLSAALTKKLTPELVRSGKLEKRVIPLMLSSLMGEIRHAEKSIYIRSPYLRNKILKKTPKLKGCNFSMHKSDILKLNGFDERYLAPACGEDTDLELRARNLGIGLKNVNHMAVQYHLHHKLLDRPAENLEILLDNKNSNATYTAYGINQ